MLPTKSTVCAGNYVTVCLLSTELRSSGGGGASATSHSLTHWLPPDVPGSHRCVRGDLHHHQHHHQAHFLVSCIFSSRTIVIILLLPFLHSVNQSPFPPFDPILPITLLSILCTSQHCTHNLLAILPASTVHTTTTTYHCHNHHHHQSARRSFHHESLLLSFHSKAPFYLPLSDTFLLPCFLPLLKLKTSDWLLIQLSIL